MSEVMQTDNWLETVVGDNFMQIKFERLKL